MRQFNTTFKGRITNERNVERSIVTFICKITNEGNIERSIVTLICKITNEGSIERSIVTFKRKITNKGNESSISSIYKPVQNNISYLFVCFMDTYKQLQ